MPLMVSNAISQELPGRKFAGICWLSTAGELL